MGAGASQEPDDQQLREYVLVRTHRLTLREGIPLVEALRAALLPAADAEGRVSFAQFAGTVDGWGVEVPPAGLQRVMERFDVAGDGRVDVAALAAFVSPAPAAVAADAAARAAFVASLSLDGLQREREAAGLRKKEITNGIRDWIAEWTAREGRAPEARDKIAIKPLYVAYKREDDLCKEIRDRVAALAAEAAATAEKAAREAEQLEKEEEEQDEEEKPAEQHGEWIAQTDPSSGLSYYYNTVTGDTQWNPPADWPGGGTAKQSRADSLFRLARTRARQAHAAKRWRREQLVALETQQQAFEVQRRARLRAALEALEESIQAEEAAAAAAGEDAAGVRARLNRRRAETKRREQEAVVADIARTRRETAARARAVEQQASRRTKGLTLAVGARMALLRDREERARDAWVEVFDVESSSTYWFNNDTGESAWDDPRPKQSALQKEKSARWRQLDSLLSEVVGSPVPADEDSARPHTRRPEDYDHDARAARSRIELGSLVS